MVRIPLYLFAVLAALAATWSAPSAAQPPAGAPKADALRLPKSRPGQEIAAQLAKVIDFSGVDDPKATLLDVLDSLGKLHRITFDVNESAFKAEEVDAVLKTEIANPTPIPPMKVSLEYVLTKIFSRVPTKSGVTYLIRRDRVEITTGAYQRKEIWGADYTGPMLPIVHLTLEKEALDDAVASLVTQTGRSIVFDPRFANKAQTPITAHFINTPLDAALFQLTDKAGLSYVQIDNVFYVTSPTRIAAIKSQWEGYRTAIAARQKAAPARTGLSFSLPRSRQAPAKRAKLGVLRYRGGQDAEYIDRLAKVVDYAGIDDPKATLSDALEQIGKVHRITFDINENAFKADMLHDVMKELIFERNPIPAMKTTLGIVLEKILSRLPNKSGAAILIRPSHFEITTGAYLRDEVWGKDFKGPILPVVHSAALKTALDEALASLANDAGMNITLDSRIGKKAQTPITTHLINVPVDAALFLLTDMADLSFVRIDNGFYVTSRERVAAMKRDWKERRPEKPAAAAPVPTIDPTRPATKK